MCEFSDVGCFQIGPDIETHFKSPSRNDAALRFETVENANQVSWKTVAEIEYENDQCDLCESSPSVER